MFTSAQYQILKRISPGEPNCCTGSAYNNKSKLAVLLGNEFFARIAGKVVIDFGCGEGSDTVEMALKGAKRAIGLDIREDLLQTAQQRAIAAGVQGKCLFFSSIESLLNSSPKVAAAKVGGSSTTSIPSSEPAEVVISVDAFEHYGDPAGVLCSMDRILQPGGEVLISFGTTWYHPMGGHLFSVFPWAHLLFSEKALLRWRSTFKHDGATRFCEVAGGLNQMTIGRFEKLVAQSPLRFANLELVPIRKLTHLHNRLTREFTTSIIRCRLVKRTGVPATAAAC